VSPAVTGASFELTIDSDSVYTGTGTSYNHSGLASGDYDVVLTATDSDGSTASGSQDDITVSGVANASGALKRYETTTPIDSTTGFASNISIEIGNFNTGDTVGVYSDSSCNTGISGLTGLTPSNIPHRVDITGLSSSSTFYIKRTVSGLSSCYGPITYTKSTVTLTSIGAEGAINSSWVVSPAVTGASFELTIDGDSVYTGTGTSYNHSGLASGDYDVVLTATDSDGSTVSGSQDDITVSTTSFPDS
jgi:hypothetical protein